LGSLIDIAVFMEHLQVLLYYNDTRRHTKSQEVQNKKSKRTPGSDSANTVFFLRPIY
jgi:hypothetical protein